MLTKYAQKFEATLILLNHANFHAVFIAIYNSYWSVDLKSLPRWVKAPLKPDQHIEHVVLGAQEVQTNPLNSLWIHLRKDKAKTTCTTVYM